MNKLDLQKELLEKVKEGVRPSDLKKQKGNSQGAGQKPGSKYEQISLKTEPEQDLGYESDSSTHSIPIAPPLPNQQVKNLQAEISSLKRQLQVYKDFREADLKIKERYKQEIKELNKTIEDLQKQAKSTAKTKPEIKTQEQGTQTTPAFFYCDICQQNKNGTYLIRKVDSPFEPRTHKKVCYVCSACQKYTKELAETNWKEKDNPYKLYD